MQMTKRRVRWKFDNKLTGTVLIEGAEVSEVKWDDGGIRNIVNEELEDEDSKRNRKRIVEGAKAPNDKNGKRRVLRIDVGRKSIAVRGRAAIPRKNSKGKVGSRRS